MEEEIGGVSYTPLEKKALKTKALDDIYRQAVSVLSADDIVQSVIAGYDNKGLVVANDDKEEAEANGKTTNAVVPTANTAAEIIEDSNKDSNKTAASTQSKKVLPDKKDLPEVFNYDPIINSIFSNSNVKYTADTINVDGVTEGKDYLNTLSSPMLGLINEFSEAGIKFRITSGYREGAKTASGNDSKHASGNAIDFVPADGDYEKVKEIIGSNPDLIRYFHVNNIGILDETTEEMLKRTNGTAPHWHIGTDHSAKKGFYNWFRDKMNEDYYSSIIKPPVEDKEEIKKALSDYSNKAWSPEIEESFVDMISRSKWPFDAILKAIKTESNFDPEAKSSSSTATGLMQITQSTAKELLGADAAKEYANNTRPVQKQIKDIEIVLNKLHENLQGENDKITFGRLKINLLAPNAGLKDKVSELVMKSVPSIVRKELPHKDATYTDLMNAYDKVYP